MTATTSESDGPTTIGLNLIVDATCSSTGTSSGGGSTKKKRKRVNKYERRRRKAANAKRPKLEDEDDDQQEEDEQQEELVAPAPAPAPAPSEQDVVQQQHQHELSEKEKEHAAYMAEYHARPLELDRRSGAQRVKKLDKKSKKKFQSESNKSSTGSHVFSQTTSWTSLVEADGCLLSFNNYSKKLVTLLTKQYSKPTKIQVQVLQQSQQHDNKNKNLWIQSETGSGKTLAYLLPILQSLLLQLQTSSSQNKKNNNRQSLGTQCIIVCPTQELVQQTFRVCDALTTQLCAGQIVVGSLQAQTSRSKEKARIRKGLAILVATPGRLLDHLQTTCALQSAISNNNLKWLVLDEVDRLFDMGLAPQLTKVIDQLKIHSAKLRLATLVAFLTDRVMAGERTIVFFSTCASVDYYHQLFTTVDSILPNNNTSSGGLFGNVARIDKLHGNVPQKQRHAVLSTFQQQQQHSTHNNVARILLATDVAARGLNLHADWTVQYDPPCEIADYIHRAGRVARAGKMGQSLLFLLPSEKSLLPILQLKQQQNATTKKDLMPALSLTSTLQQAAKLCPHLANKGMQRNGMRAKAMATTTTTTTTTTTAQDEESTSNSNNDNGRHGSRLGEAFCSELQYRLEECVLEQSRLAQAAIKDANNKNKNKKKTFQKIAVADMTLLDCARAAFLSHMRAYPTKEKLVRHIFSARALHLGHIAKSFALREPPKTLVANSRRVESKSRKQQQQPDDEARTNGTARKRALLMANAAKLQMGGMDDF
ncbi:dependent RNA helicase [Seminavis robusta]|uniref:ATP-dependent RNA helicase n=1 Tax=Seminavis robusta TaxID=568900 RepID=A0A9N8ECY7_9STRA|nr:dependent RNA helicase [Seminavis robusta]|eukprot:Sro967_g225820.1 dependent RNA helicase (763) ;mRNA; r:13679-16207